MAGPLSLETGGNDFRIIYDDRVTVPQILWQVGQAGMHKPAVSLNDQQLCCTAGTRWSEGYATVRQIKIETVNIHVRLMNLSDSQRELKE
jgi:hypothetical protein